MRLGAFSAGKLGLHEFLDGLQAKLNVVGNEITSTFFDLTPNP